MRLSAVEIRDYRSIFVDDGGLPLRLDLARGMNSLVGRNNCGKSNVLRAISLALDPQHELDLAADVPGPRPFALPIVTLDFQGDRADDRDTGVLAAAAAYERAADAGGDDHLSAEGKVTLEVAFQPSDGGTARSERLVTRPHLQLPTTPEVQELMDSAITALRDAVRFVLISSGESIESVLEGNFREILHTVVRQRLRSQFEAAEESRRTYVSGLEDSLLRPLRDRLTSDVCGIFPEIEAIALAPEVSAIEDTLSNVEVTVQDLVATPLSGKGTGVRGGLLVAMLSYLATDAAKTMVFAVEEPEAFLHPAAQEDLRDRLEALARIPGVDLIVTTHSPYTVTQSGDGRVFCLAKDREGRTRLAESAPGDADHAPLIGDLMRPATLEALLQSSSAVPPGTEGIVLVEGDGDRFCMNLCAEVLGRPDLLEGLYIRPTGGTVKMLAEAIIVRAATELPMVIIVDNDTEGRETRTSLVGHKIGFDKKQVATYAEVFGKADQWPNFPVEAEDLFAPELIAGFVEQHGNSVIDGSKKRPDDYFHYDLCQAAKEKLEAWLHESTRPEHLERWVEMLLLVRARAGLPVPDESPPELIAGAPVRRTVGESLPGLALIVAGAHDHTRYLETSALVLEASFTVPAEVTHVAFYAKGIQPHIPRIVADHPGLSFTEQTAQLLRGTGKANDQRAAAVIDRMVQMDPTLAGTGRRVLLLSAPDAPETLVLEEPVTNTKRISGRPVAWTLGPKLIPVQALAAGVTTTDDLDKAIDRLSAKGAAT
jgi:putative ATP-dependent endonuclease of OLD family